VQHSCSDVDCRKLQQLQLLVLLLLQLLLLLVLCEHQVDAVHAADQV
jgi:hypothetical protein